MSVEMDIIDIDGDMPRASNVNAHLLSKHIGQAPAFQQNEQGSVLEKAADVFNNPALVPRPDHSIQKKPEPNGPIFFQMSAGLQKFLNKDES